LGSDGLVLLVARRGGDTLGAAVPDSEALSSKAFLEEYRQKALRVLFVEDDPDDAELTLREIQRTGCLVESERVQDANGMRSALERKPWDVVLSDWAMPTFSAPAALAVLKETGLDLPFIIISGTIGEESAVEAMRAGAHDFVLKGKLTRLTAAVVRELGDKKVRDALARSEKVRTLGQMAAGISHDLKNILNPLFLHIEVATRANARSDMGQVAEALGEMKQALKRGVDVTERLRQFSRQTPDSPMAGIDLNALAREAVQLAKPRMASGGGRLSRIHEKLGTPPPVFGQSSEIVSALLNLLVNAIDARPHGGSITILTSEERGGACIAVADDGPGMTPEVQARVFEPFFTTKGTEGTGLGLATVYATVHRHGGTVRLDSEPGNGTTFTLWFPPQRCA
jgi:signal transduction histidine kinase